MKLRIARTPMFPAILSMISALGIFAGDPTGPIEPLPENLISPEASWPSPLGPNNTRAASPGEFDLVTSFRSARPVWKSETIPDARAASVTGNADTNAWSGAFSSPVLANGKVYLYYFVPSGTVKDKDLYEQTGYEQKWLINADDIVICIEAQTGKTLWKKVYEEAGINWNGFTKSGPGQSPVVKNGNVYAVGSAGKVYCLNAEDGEEVWVSDMGIRAREMEEVRAKSIEAEKLPSFNRDFCSQPVVAGGAMVMTDHVYHKFRSAGWPTSPTSGWTYHYEVTNGLHALDALTGDSIWAVPECVQGSDNGPAVFEHEGEEYIVAADKEKVMCIGPAEGNILWREDVTHGHSYLAPTVGEGVLVTIGPDDGPGLVGYSVTPDTLIKLWESSSAYGRVVSRPSIAGGLVYAISSSSKKLIAVDLQTGEVKATADYTQGTNREHDNGYICATWGVLIGNGDVNARGILMHDATPVNGKLNRFLSYDFIWNFDVPPAYGYITRIIPAFADGRAFVRLRDGIMCFDLRDPNPSVLFDEHSLAGIRLSRSVSTRAHLYDLHGRRVTGRKGSSVSAPRVLISQPVRGSGGSGLKRMVIGE